jgi:hypothetical protein
MLARRICSTGVLVEAGAMTARHVEALNWRPP